MKAGTFTDARGAERMRQSFARAIAAGVTDGDLNVLHAVHVETIGRSKITNTTTSAHIAYALGRLERIDNEDDLEPAEYRRRKRVKDRVGAALKRLAYVGAITYEAGRGSRFSVIGLPEMDDAKPTSARGLGNTDDEAPSPRDDVPQAHADEVPKPTPPRPPSPRGDVDLQIETDGADRRRSGLVREIVQEAPDRSPASAGPVDAWSELVRLHLAARHLAADVTPDTATAILAHLAMSDDHPPDHRTLTLTIAAATARHTDADPITHLDEADMVAAHLTEHYDRDLITATILATYHDPDEPGAHIIRRPSALVQIARHIADDRLPYGHEAPPFKPPKATPNGARHTDTATLLERYT